LSKALSRSFASIERQVAQILALELEQVERPQKRPRLARAATQQVARGDALGIGDDRLERSRERLDHGVE
jgi:hypothetical protein